MNVSLVGPLEKLISLSWFSNIFITQSYIRWKGNGIIWTILMISQIVWGNGYYLSQCVYPIDQDDAIHVLDMSIWVWAQPVRYGVVSFWLSPRMMPVNAFSLKSKVWFDDISCFFRMLLMHGFRLKKEVRRWNKDELLFQSHWIDDNRPVIMTRLGRRNETHMIRESMS